MCDKRVYFLLLICCLEYVFGIHVSNLNDSCIRCLCHLNGCDTTHHCTDGYCGPFYISMAYWHEAGRPTQPNDDPQRKGAFEDCAKEYYCSIEINKQYISRFAKDCNGDGVTDCFDYMMINFNGGRSCSAPLGRNEEGMKKLSRFEECRLDEE